MILNFDQFLLWLWQDIWERPAFYVTMILSLLGAHLTSGPKGNARLRGLGFMVWIFSNGYIGWSFLLEQNWPMVVTFGAYELYNARGVWNNWFKKS